MIFIQGDLLITFLVTVAKCLTEGRKVVLALQLRVQDSNGWEGRSAGV